MVDYLETTTSLMYLNISGFVGLTQDEFVTICEKVSESKCISSVHLSDMQLFSEANKDTVLTLQEVFGL